MVFIIILLNPKEEIVSNGFSNKPAKNIHIIFLLLMIPCFSACMKR